MKNEPAEELSLASHEQSQAVVPAQTSVIDLLAAAVKGGITSENVAIAKELIAMRREELDRQNKVAFNKAFFQLRQEIAKMDFYADKEARTESGTMLYTFCSERELTSKLEPLLFKYGFAMMFGQRQENERVVAEITLVHQDGHEEKREYAVRMGSTNRAKDATQADTGSTTSAWRHLVIKLFGIKSRIVEGGDIRNEGEVIPHDKVQYLRERVKETGFNERSFLKLAGVATYEEIRQGSYDVLTRALEMKAKQPAPAP